MNGTVIKKKMFKTGSLRILPRTMIDVFEHNIEDKELLEWLLNFDLDKIKKWKLKIGLTLQIIRIMTLKIHSERNIPKQIISYIILL
nr:MAG TPA_asm: hypothetical protein [Caudoviricetes sp.]